MTDAELLLRVQRGDLTAWRPLYARCLPTVWRQACLLVGDESVAEDIAGETMLALVRSLRKLDAETVSLHAWLRGVVQHKVSDYGRQRARQRRLVAALRNGSLDHEPSPAPETSLEVEEARQQVLDTLELLSEQQRLVLEWKHADDQSVREIAARLGQTEKSVESSLYRARKEFRRLHQRVHPDEVRSNRSADVRVGPLKKSLG